MLLKQTSIVLCGLILILTSGAGSIRGNDEPPASLVVVTWNVEWMFDDYRGDNRSDLSVQQSAPSKEAWQAKVAAVASALAAMQANIIALQEIEGDQTLAAIAGELKQKHNLNYRFAFIQGTDRHTEHDVGLLFSSGLTHYRRHEQTKAMFASNNFYNLSKHLVAEFRWRTVESPLTLMTVHQRATEDAEDFRIRQARLARYWLEPQLAQGQDVILLGDLNTEQPVGDASGDMQELIGPTSPHPLVDLLKFAKPDQRRTHLILDRAYDRILVSPSLVEDGPGLDWVFKDIVVRGDLVVQGKPDGREHWDQRLTLPPSELDTSDHFPVVATFDLK